MKTLLQIVQEASSLVGMPRPAVVVSATSDTPKRMLALLNEAGEQLATEHSWSVLTDVEQFTATAAQVQANQPPSDFARFTNQAELWDVNNRRQVAGPLPMSKWVRVVIDPPGGVEKYWTYIGGAINILPVPSASDSFIYSYQSKNWVLSSAAASKDSFTADDDTPKLNDELLKMELVWRWKHTIGVDYGEDMASANRKKEELIAQDRGPGVLNLSNPFRGDLPEGYWPGVITP